MGYQMELYLLFLQATRSLQPAITLMRASSKSFGTSVAKGMPSHGNACGLLPGTMDSEYQNNQQTNLAAWNQDCFALQAGCTNKEIEDKTKP